MAKLILDVILFAAMFAEAKSLQLELYAQASLPVKSKFADESVGGLSGFFWEGGKLTAICDDRGKLGKPRFYELDLKVTAGKAEFAVSRVHHLKEMPKDWFLDLEAIAALPNGDLVISTEGDNNKKPRAMPHLFVVGADGVYKSDLSLPEKFLPETTGLQKKGIENNRGFEGLTVNPNGQSLYAINEYPLIPDQDDSDQNYWLRLLEFKKDKDRFKAVAEYPYVLSRLPSNSSGPEMFRGISEILWVSEGKFLVLERGARLTKTGIAYTGGLYLADIVGVKDVSLVKSLADGKTPAIKKEKLVDFEELFKGQQLENFEALAWGPALPDGRKSLLVLSDNNFSNKEKTMLLVFAVKEVE